MKKSSLIKNEDPIAGETLASQHQSFEKQLAEAHKELKNASQKVTQLQAQLDTFEQNDDTELAEAESNLKKAQNQKNEVQQTLQSATIENINKLRQKIIDKQNDILSEEQRLTDLKNIKNDQSQPQSENKTQITQLQEKISALTAHQQEMTTKAKNAQQAVTNATKAVQEAHEKALKQAKQVDLNTARYDLRGVQRELVTIDESLAELQAKLSLLQGDPATNLKATETKLLQDEKTLIALQNKLTILKDGNERLQSAQNAVRKAQRHLEQVKRQQSNSEVSSIELAQQLTDAKSKKLEIEQRIQTLEVELATITQDEEHEHHENQKLPRVGEKRKHVSFFKMAAITMSEFLTHLGFKKKKTKK